MALDVHSEFRRFVECLLPGDPPRERLARRAVTAALEDCFLSILRHAKPLNVCEVGAHEGSFSLAVRRALPDCTVWAMEANPQVWAKHNSRLTQAGVQYLQMGIGAESGPKSFSVPLKGGVPDTTMGSILTDTWASEHTTIEIQIEPLDAFLASRNASGPFALWIDVEGAVSDVIGGAARTLAQTSAVFVELETTQRWSGQHTAEEVLQILAQYDLKPFLCDVQRTFQCNLICLGEELLSDTEFVRAKRSAYYRRVRDAVLNLPAADERST